MSMLDHPPTDQCSDSECLECGERDCPQQDPMHYHHDGCPTCWSIEQAREKEGIK